LKSTDNLDWQINFFGNISHASRNRGIERKLTGVFEHQIIIIKQCEKSFNNFILVFPSSAIDNHVFSSSY